MTSAAVTTFALVLLLSGTSAANAAETGEAPIMPESQEQPVPDADLAPVPAEQAGDLPDADAAPTPAELVDDQPEPPITEDDPSAAIPAVSVDETPEPASGVADVPRPDEDAPPAIGDPIPVDNGARAVVRSCEWDSYTVTPYPSCYIEVTPPDMSPRTYTVNLRDIEATPAFIGLGADLTEWFWLWERTEGAQLSFTTDGTQASSGAKLDMGRVPPIIEPGEPIKWSCFADLPAPPDVEYDLPTEPPAFEGTATVGAALAISLADLIHGTEWQTARPSRDSALRLEGPDTDGSFTWTPTAAGVYEFSYHLGSPNCVTAALTGTITVTAPAVVIDVPPIAPLNPEVTLIEPGKGVATPSGLAETGANPSMFSVAALLLLAGGLSAALASLRAQRRRAGRSI